MVRLKEQEIPYRIGDAVIDLLKRKKITQTKLAKLLGESLPSFQKKIRREDIGVGYITRVSRILNYDFLCEASYKNQIQKFGFADQKRDVDLIDLKYHEVVVKLMETQSELLAVRDKLSKLEKEHQFLLEQSPVRLLKSRHSNN